MFSPTWPTNIFMLRSRIFEFELFAGSNRQTKSYNGNKANNRLNLSHFPCQTVKLSRIRQQSRQVEWNSTRHFTVLTIHFFLSLLLSPTSYHSISPSLLLHSRSITIFHSLSPSFSYSLSHNSLSLTQLSLSHTHTHCSIFSISILSCWAEVSSNAKQRGVNEFEVFHFSTA